jgi:formylglycine-generating enzyme required for sulfatase activity
MDKYEVTQESFQTLTGFNPSKWEGKKSPLESVRWRQAVKYCNARSKKDGLKPCYDEKTGKCDFTANGYRLPTEAEWEYACRAGTTSNYSFGDKPELLKEFGWFKGNSGKKPHFVGEKKANPWGLCDLQGNVWEWCNDFYDPEYYKKSPEKDPRGPEKTGKKVLRGGSWDNQAESCTSFYRYSDNPACSDICLGYDIYGFRCVRNAEKTK